MWFPSEKMMCCAHLAGLQFNSTLGQQEQAVQAGSVSGNYGVPGSLRWLQYVFCSSLHCDFAFLSSNTREKKLQKRKKERK
jgi:hypothetical protein